MKAIVDDKIPYIRGQIEQLVDQVTYMPGSAISPTDVRNADILIVRTRTRCDAHLLEGSAVRLIVTATIGFDHIDTDYCTSHGIEWTNCPGCNARSVCCYVINSLRLLGKLQQGLTIGIVGVGHVGTLVASAASQHGMRPLLCDPPRRDAGSFVDGLPFVSLSDIASEADIITFHTPLTTQGLYSTYHMADAPFFRSLQKRPVIINASRGAVVDNGALLSAVRSGMVADAVVDTWEGEPSHIDTDLLSVCAVATPHVAGYSADGKANATRMSLSAVARFLGRDFMPSIVLPDAGLLSVETLYDDTRKMKLNPQQFEYMREHYPTRREPTTI